VLIVGYWRPVPSQDLHEGNTALIDRLIADGPADVKTTAPTPLLLAHLTPLPLHSGQASPNDGVSSPLSCLITQSQCALCLILPLPFEPLQIEHLLSAENLPFIFFISIS